MLVAARLPPAARILSCAWSSFWNSIVPTALGMVEVLASFYLNYDRHLEVKHHSKPWTTGSSHQKTLLLSTSPWYDSYRCTSSMSLNKKHTEKPNFTGNATRLANPQDEHLSSSRKSSKSLGNCLQTNYW